MCALHAAGYEAEVSAMDIHPIRAQLRGELLQLQGPATQQLRQYYRERLLADPAANLSRYISFALVVGPPPKFELLFRREELPPDVLTIAGFGEMLAEFYREAEIEKLWERVQPVYEREIQKVQGPLGDIVLTATSYLREVHRPMRSVSFTVYVEPLVGGKTNFRSFHNQYSIVLSPGGEVPVEEIRHAYLHFLLDSLAVRYRAHVASREPLHRYVSRAARLAPEYRDDFSALLTECLVRAVELRLKRLPAARAAQALDAAEADGFILVRAFYEGLEKFEKAEPAMSFYFPELVSGVDLAKESRRLEQVVFAAAEAPREPAHAKRTEASEVESWLREGEVRIAAQDGAGAVAWFEKVLARQPEHPRGLYGLGVARVLQGQGEAAKEIFLRLAAWPAQIDPVVRAWANVYLGRIHDVEGHRELALSAYRAALAVDGAPEAARLAARRGIEKGFEPVRTGRDAGPQRP
jgi:tetratricopeptide (TPR) repeat protein